MPIDPKLMSQMTDAPSSRSIEKLIGEDNFALLSEVLGGRKIYIPKVCGVNSPMATVIGYEAAALLSEVWAGMEYSIPLRVGRTQSIIRLYKAGVPIVRISAHLKISISSAQKVISSMKASEQLSMDL